MSAGQRLREERLRLGYSQPAFAGLAGVTKGAVVKWEKGTASPNAIALMAFAEVGADALYILTGKREPVFDADADWVSILDEIQRSLIDPAFDQRQDESEEQRHDRVLGDANARLRRLLQFDARNRRPETVERIKTLLSWTENPTELVKARAVDFAQKDENRGFARTALSIWFTNWECKPSQGALDALAECHVDYGVPIAVLVRLALEIYGDAKGEKPARIVRDTATDTPDRTA